MGANKILRYAKLNQRHLLLNFSNNVIWVSAVQHYSDIGWPALISLDDEAESSVSSFRYHNTLYRQTAMFKINTSRRRERKGSNFERRERKKRANPLESTIHETKMSIILTKKKKTTRDPCENFFDVLRISLALSFFFQRSNSVKHDWQMITISKHKKQNKTGKKAFVETPSRSIKVRSNVRFADRQLRFVRDRIFTKKKSWTSNISSYLSRSEQRHRLTKRNRQLFSSRYVRIVFINFRFSSCSLRTFHIVYETPGLYTTALFHKQKETRRFVANKLNFPPFIVCENNKCTNFGGGGANGIIVEAVSYYELVPQHVSGLAATVMRSRAKNLYSGKADCKWHPIVSPRTLPTNDALLGRKEKNAWYIEK